MAEPRHFIDLWRLAPSDLRAILDDARARKAARKGWPQGRVDADAPGAERTLAMIFQKNSTRTRFSFDAAMRQLGGDVIISTAADMQLGRGETVADTAMVLSRMVDAVMIRANSHEDVEEFARVASVPVINGLTDRSHPCQILANFLTIEERFGSIDGKVLAWVGDGNNVCSSFIHAAAAFNFELRIAAPAAYGPNAVDLARTAERQGRVEVTEDPRAAVAGADAVITDTWVSMGDTDRDARLAALGPYQVDAGLMALAAPHAIFMHDLPAHRGEEVTAEVFDGPRSTVWDEAENRIHAQKSVLAWCFDRLGKV
ncbi:ornithine carbamoyltransferase [Phenylobacterium sp.]|uniref:ornithine carbamoyltransferase n=1 Tax=Phenylobacterium sp. TaxID=1871053 RepID=UPI0027360AEA|nr:ornithine carbamoyltransferase [Phenylobacterium sp.]MDP3658949.1 ornithine carbamoyltransferase [Phenylobacterium sp.]